MTAPRLLSCPICKKRFDAAQRDHAPFCSARCKTIDLGNWLGGTYAVPADDAGPVPSADDDDPSAR